MTTKPIERIYVLTCAKDVHLTKLCVASIRYWYPDFPVSLIVDHEAGEFDLDGLEEQWRLDRFETPVRRFGWGLSRLDLLFRPEPERYLVLDSDIVLLGPVLEHLNRFAGDFIVHPEEQTPAELERVTFSVDRLQAIDPAFVPPRHVFNCGQYVATSGLLRREDFDAAVEWSEPRRLRHPDVFACGDQGIFNYVLAKAEAAGRVTVSRERFFYWRRDDTSAITVEDIAARRSPARLLHWAGLKAPTVEGMERADILAFYARFARRRRSLRQRWRAWQRLDLRALVHARKQRLRFLFRQWQNGTPYADGGIITQIAADRLENFHDFERVGGLFWRWTEPAASIELRLRRSDHLVRIETASPDPLPLAETGLRFFINEREISPEKILIEDGTAWIDLDAALLAHGPRQRLSWTMRPLEVAPSEDRLLGMPISALWVFRRRHW